MLLSIVFVIILGGFAVAMIVQWQRGRRSGPRTLDPRMVQGTLTITGVSDRPASGDKNGQMFCTISGTVLGPETAPTEVYRRIVVADGQPWPQIGADLPVVYRPGKVETTWQLGAIPPAQPGPPR